MSRCDRDDAESRHARGDFLTGHFPVASAPGAASVRVWQLMSRCQGPGAGRPPSEGAKGRCIWAMASGPGHRCEDAQVPNFRLVRLACGERVCGDRAGGVAVSYTHLTLPTSD